MIVGLVAFKNFENTDFQESKTSLLKQSLLECTQGLHRPYTAPDHTICFQYLGIKGGGDTRHNTIISCDLTPHLKP